MDFVWILYGSRKETCIEPICISSNPGCPKEIRIEPIWISSYGFCTDPAYGFSIESIWILPGFHVGPVQIPYGFRLGFCMDSVWIPSGIRCGFRVDSVWRVCVTRLACPWQIASVGAVLAF